MYTNAHIHGDAGTTRLGRALLVLPIATLLLSACGPGNDETAEGNLDSERPATVAEHEGAGATEEKMAETGRQLALATSPDLGEYVTSPRGPVYVFTADTKNEASACYDACADAWPPVTGELDVSGELDPSLLGSITREDGTRQVTYGGWPLYRFARDGQGGTPTGEGMEGFGGEWYLVGPDGHEIEEPAGEEAASTPS